MSFNAFVGLLGILVTSISIYQPNQDPYISVIIVLSLIGYWAWLVYQRRVVSKNHAKILLNYSSKDLEPARIVYKALEQQQAYIWFANQHLADFDDESTAFDKGIEQCKYLLILKTAQYDTDRQAKIRSNKFAKSEFADHHPFTTVAYDGYKGDDKFRKGDYILFDPDKPENLIAHVNKLLDKDKSEWVPFFYGLALAAFSVWYFFIETPKKIDDNQPPPEQADNIEDNNKVIDIAPPVAPIETPPSHFDLKLQLQIPPPIKGYVVLSLPDSDNTQTKEKLKSTEVGFSIKYHLLNKQAALYILLEQQQGQIIWQENIRLEHKPLHIQPPNSAEIEKPEKLPLPLQKVLADEYEQADAQLSLATAYDLGEYHQQPVSQNSEKAYGYYAKAAAQGNAEAQNQQGLMLQQGRGVALQAQQAFALFQQAKQQNYIPAFWNLAHAHRLGIGTDKDEGLAFVALQDAAVAMRQIAPAQLKGLLNPHKAPTLTEDKAWLKQVSGDNYPEIKALEQQLETDTTTPAPEPIEKPESLSLAQQRQRMQQVASERYEAYPDGTALDKETGLVWMRCAMGQTWNGETCEGSSTRYKWQAAKQLKVEFAGYDDWRLPDIEALRTLVYCSNGQPEYFSMAKDAKETVGCSGLPNKDYLSPTIVQPVFPSTKASFFRSSTPWAGTSNDAWGVHFHLGSDDYDDTDGTWRVRLVRGGQ